MPGLWFMNSQRQFSLLVPPRAIRRLEVQYQWPGVGSNGGRAGVASASDSTHMRCW
jgi:hypothetical protein